MTFRIKKLFCGGLLLLCSACWSPAQEVVSGIFGFYKLDLLGNSDTIVSIPFARLPADTALVSSTNSGNVIQVQGVPNWTANQFVYAQGVQSNTYYVRFESGALEGRQFDISSNGTNSLTVNLAGGSLAGALANDQISIVPHWTLWTVFANGNGIHMTTSIFSLKTEVLIPSVTNSGINLGAAATYYYITNSGSGTGVWNKISGGTTSRNDDVIPINTSLIIRHNIATNTTFISLGDVILTTNAIILRVNASQEQDNSVGLTRPIAVSLDDSTLIASGAFVPTSNIFFLKDQLLTFNNATNGFNKSADATYYYYNSGWRKIGANSGINFGASNIFVPGAGFIIRKAATTNAPIWLNSATY